MPEEYKKVTGLSWFDNYHIIFNRGQDVILAEFDGNYAQTIAKGSSSAPYGSSDTKSVLVNLPGINGTSDIKSIKIRQ